MIKNILDRVLLSLYHEDKYYRYPINQILNNCDVIINDYQEQLQLASRLEKDDLVELSASGGIIKLRLLDAGVIFCETTSYSQPNVPIIKQM